MSQVKSQTHFELFELPVSFDIDLQLLNTRFRKLQRVVHPDRFANASDRERRLSMEKATQINDAFQVLKSPQRRARYILELQGVSFDNEQDMSVDAAFLMEQIELREALAEITDGETALDEINKILKDISERIASVLSELSELFSQGSLDETQKSNAKQCVHKIQFLNKLQQEAEQREESLLNAF